MPRRGVAITASERAPHAEGRAEENEQSQQNGTALRGPYTSQSVRRRCGRALAPGWQPGSRSAPSLLDVELDASVLLARGACLLVHQRLVGPRSSRADAVGLDPLGHEVRLHRVGA